MLSVIYEDKEIIVADKPVGIDSQSNHGFSADMVSEIKKHIHMTSTTKGDPYVGVIHRLDKPVGGVILYAKTRQAAAQLSLDVRDGKMEKRYLAVLCGKPVDNVGNFVDYMLKVDRKNYSKIVDNVSSPHLGKRAELKYQVIQTKIVDKSELTLVDVTLLTGRHHQIRVQFAGHEVPLWGDCRYNPEFIDKKGVNVALAAWKLSFHHPQTGRKMYFEKVPDSGMFREFPDILISYKGSTNQK